MDHIANNKKAMQSFFGKIDFAKKFIYDFIKSIKILKKNINKDVVFQWIEVEK